MGTFSGDIEKKLYGYVVFIRMYSVWDNQAYNGGVVRVLYGGINKTFLGDVWFEPYKSEESARRSSKAWEKWIKKLGEIGEGWKYQVGGVMPVTESMYDEMEKQYKQDTEIVSKISLPEFSGTISSGIKKANRRKSFKRIK